MKNENKKTDWIPVWIFLGTLFLIGLVMSVVSTAKGIPVNDDRINAISTIANNAIITLIFLILYRKRLKADLKRLTKKNIIYIIVGAAILVIANWILSSLFEYLNVKMENQNSLSSSLSFFKVPMIISIVFMSPFYEEIVFRYSIETVCKSEKTFIIVSAIIFGICHGIGIATIIYILIGVALAFIYLKNDKNVIAPISVHIINNLISVLGMLL